MMDKKTEKKISKYLSYVLRHHPEAISIDLDKNGWAHTEELIEKVNEHTDFALSREKLESVVNNNDKKRFIFSDGLERIRANQGHSIGIDLGLKANEPPEYLYHGTANTYVASIRKEGLIKGERQHVHLSPDEKTAKAVGGRHGKPIVLIILSGKMHASGQTFFLSDNGVWLTEYVPVDFIEFPAP